MRMNHTLKKITYVISSDGDKNFDLSVAEINLLEFSITAIQSSGFNL